MHRGKDHHCRKRDHEQQKSQAGKLCHARTLRAQGSLQQQFSQAQRAHRIPQIRSPGSQHLLQFCEEEGLKHNCSFTIAAAADAAAVPVLSSAAGAGAAAGAEEAASAAWLGVQPWKKQVERTSAGRRLRNLISAIWCSAQRSASLVDTTRNEDGGFASVCVCTELPCADGNGGHCPPESENLSAEHLDLTTTVTAIRGAPALGLPQRHQRGHWPSPTRSRALRGSRAHEGGTQGLS